MINNLLLFTVIARKLKSLEESGELANTIVVVTADNGMPFPRIKGQEYEYSNHLPLAIMWPDGIKKPGRIVDDYVNFIDFTPTFLELAGLKAEKVGMKPVTGTSLTDILYSPKSGIVNKKRDFILIAKERHDVGRPNDEGYPIRGILKNGFLFLRNFEPTRWPVGNPETGYMNVDASPTKSYILNTRRTTGSIEYWQPNFGKRVAEELYNIKEDPFCMNNLATDCKYTKRKTTMEKEMIKRLKSQKDPRMFGNGAIFESYKYFGPNQNYYNRFIKGELSPKEIKQKEDIDADLMEK